MVWWGGGEGGGAEAEGGGAEAEFVEKSVAAAKNR